LRPNINSEQVKYYDIFHPKVSAIRCQSKLMRKRNFTQMWHFSTQHKQMLCNYFWCKCNSQCNGI